MNQLKKLIINAAMEKFDKIYIHALPHNKLIVGEREIHFSLYKKLFFSINPFIAVSSFLEPVCGIHNFKA